MTMRSGFFVLRARRTLRVLRDTTGSAALEFIAAALVLLVPCVYAVLAFGSIESAQFAVTGAARHAARIFVEQATPATASRVARESALVSVREQAPQTTKPSVSVTCRGECLSPGGTVTIRVAVRVPLPFLPQWPAVRRFTSVRVSASATQSHPRLGMG
jgi:Flp pilus assembly protein TadG